MGRLGSRLPRAIVSFALVALAAASVAALDKKEYKVYVVVDILRPKFQEVIDGFRQVLDAQLAAAGAKAAYSIYDTKTDPSLVPGILAAIKEGRPDLVFAINSPAAFADKNVSLKLDPSILVVSENCIPIQSKVAKGWNRPGGSITGVGVFVRMDSLIKLAKMVNPKYRKLVFFSWDRMTEINEWFVAELKDACKKEGVELAMIRYTSSAEDSFGFLSECDRLGEEYFGIEAISAWVHRDGSYADMAVEEKRFFIENLRHFPMCTYEETGVIGGIPMGICIIWRDLGAQLGEKAMKVLQGARPGDIPWDYPRKYNIMLNLAGARLIGLSFPQSVIGAAYRVYTDFEGNFIGKKD